MDDWENFKMPGAPYADMGPLPPPPAKIATEGKTRLTFIPETFFGHLESTLGKTGPYTLLWGGLLAGISKEYLVMGPEMAQSLGMILIFGYGIIPAAAPFLDREETIAVEHRDKQIETWKNYKIGLVKSEIDGIARLKEQTAGLALIQEQRKNLTDRMLRRAPQPTG